MNALAFDLGNVIFDFDYNIALDKIRPMLSVSVDKIIEDLFCTDFTLAYERGEVSDRGFYREFKKKFAHSLTFNDFVDSWCPIFSPKHKVIELIKRLKRKYPLYLISNINELHFNYLHKKYPEVLSLFNSLVLSYKVKSVKPELKIYETLKNLSGRRYEEIIYIDDRSDLISVAKNFGLKCIQFVGYDHLVNSLASFGIEDCFKLQ